MGEHLQMAVIACAKRLDFLERCELKDKKPSLYELSLRITKKDAYQYLIGAYLDSDKCLLISKVREKTEQLKSEQMKIIGPCKSYQDYCDALQGNYLFSQMEKMQGLSSELEHELTNRLLTLIDITDSKSFMEALDKSIKKIMDKNEKELKSSQILAQKNEIWLETLAQVCTLPVNIQKVSAYINSIDHRPDGWDIRIKKLLGPLQQGLSLIVIADQDEETRSLANLKAERIKLDGNNIPKFCYSLSRGYHSLGSLVSEVTEIELVGHWGVGSASIREGRIKEEIIELNRQLIACQYPNIQSISLRACKIAVPHTATLKHREKPPIELTHSVDFNIIKTDQFAIDAVANDLMFPAARVVCETSTKKVYCCLLLSNTDITSFELSATSYKKYLLCVNDSQALQALTKYTPNNDALVDPISSMLYARDKSLIVLDRFGQEQRALIAKYHDISTPISPGEKAAIKQFYARAVTFEKNPGDPHNDFLSLLACTLEQRGSKHVKVKGYVDAVLQDDFHYNSRRRPYNMIGDKRPSESLPKAYKISVGFFSKPGSNVSEEIKLFDYAAH